MSINFFNSLKTKLFLWYIGSLLLLTVIFFLFVHYWAIPFGTDLFFISFLILTIIGFIIIYKITTTLTYLSNRMKMISEKNLGDRITDIKSQDELGQLASTFNDLLDRINQAFKREQQFIGDVAHEMKTPLATLKSELEVALQKTRSKDEYQKALKDAIVETDQLSSTLKNVLDLAWIESPQLQKNKTKIDLSELMNELVEIAKKLTINKNININSDIKTGIYISGFKDRLGRALLNIIDNAIKYSKVNGKVEILLEQSPTLAVITIKDNGRGIMESEISHIFDRFYRGAKTEKVFGAGLGLAIAKSIITLHQGEIKVKSQPDKGSSFIITLPLSS